MLANLLQDLRYALHGFALRPVFAGTVVLTLALAIGVNVAAFSLYDQIMLRELPVSRPDELVKLVSAGPRVGNQLANQQGGDEHTFSYPLFRDLAAAGEAVVDLAASWIAQVSLADGDRTVRRLAVLVTGDYFTTLGVGPALGRVIGAEDVVDTELPQTVVLSFEYWTTAFGADPAVIGSTLIVSGRSMRIVGVAPRGFVGMTPGVDAAVFVPVTFEWYRNASLPTSILEDRFFSYLYVFGRLRPGVSPEAAQATLDSAFRAIINDVEAPAAAARPRFNRMDEFRARTLSLVPAARGQSRAPEYARTPLAVFLAATATILLIACVNLANLMFARAAARIREIAVRASLGAARRRLYSLLSVEALLLAGIAGVASLPIALGVLHAVDALQPPGLAVNALALDLRMAAVAFAVATIAALVFAIAPMIKLVSVDPVRALHSSGARTFGGKNLGRFRFSLVTAQIALSMSLLVLAALFIQSLVNTARVDLGLRTESIVTFQVSPAVNGYSAERGAQAIEAIERELAAQPGVTSVSTSGVPLLSNSQWRTTVSVDGAESTNVNANEVGPSFFATLDIPLLAGRAFTDSDTIDTPSVAIVNESFATRFSLGANPVGKRFSFNPTGEPPYVEIVGLIRDSAYDGVKMPFVPQVIIPRQQSSNFGSGVAFYVRTAQAPDAMLAAVPRVVASVDSSLPVMDARTLASQVRRNLQTDWLLVALAGVLATIATLLAAIGIYGVLSYMVAQRTREIGLRVALGAQAAGVRRMVMRQVAWMVIVGVPLGVAAALLIGKFASALLFGLAATDPRAVAAAGIVLAIAVLGASYWPARRASRVDPVVALRAE